jgi:O-antigen ligase
MALPLLLYSYGDSLSAAFASPDALTGRVQIWPVLIAYSRDHWMQGSGYGSFWNIGGASPAYEYATGRVSTIASGHNGYLDLLAPIGVPGLLLVSATANVVPARRRRVAESAPAGG